MQQSSQKKILSRKNTAYRIQKIFANYVSGKGLVSRIYVLCLVALLLLLLSHFSRVRFCETPQMAPTRLPCPWDSLGKNIGVGGHFLLQEIFPTQGSNSRLLHLLHWRQILYCYATWEALWKLLIGNLIHRENSSGFSQINGTKY